MKRCYSYDQQKARSGPAVKAVWGQNWLFRGRSRGRKLNVSADFWTP